MSQFYLVLFSPWLLVIPHQTNFHKIHWTDGSLPFGESLIGFFAGVVSMIYTLQGDLNYFELSISLVAITTSFYVLRKERLMLKIIVGTFTFYFMEVLVFDWITNHHTIIVNRYYIFLLILFYWLIAVLFDATKGKFRFLLLGIITVLSIHSFVEIYSLRLAPKQMMREVANYIDSKFESESTLVVVEPAGVAVWGLSLYLHGDFEMLSADDLKFIGTNKRIIFIDEMLGDKISENHLNHEEQIKMKSVPFVGLIVYE